MKTLDIEYVYEYETFDADKAMALLGSAAHLASNHSDTDACLILEPFRLILDREDRLLEGTDALAHIAGTGRPLEAVVYRETPTGPTEGRSEKRAEQPCPAAQLAPRIKQTWPFVGDAVNFKSVAIQLERCERLGEDHLDDNEPTDTGRVLAMLDRMDVRREYELYKQARRTSKRLAGLSGIRLAVLMHIQERLTDTDTMNDFWNGVLDHKPGPQAWLADRLADKTGAAEFHRLAVAAWNAWRTGGAPKPADNQVCK